MPLTMRDSTALPALFDPHPLSESQREVIRAWAKDRHPNYRDLAEKIAVEWLESGHCWWGGTDRCVVNLKPVGAFLELHFAALPGGLREAIGVMEQFGREVWPSLGYPDIITANMNRALWRVLRSHGRRIAASVGAVFDEPAPGRFTWRRCHA